MKKSLKNKLYLLLPFFLLLLFAACKQNESETSQHRHEEEYSCPMHPQVIQKEPGSCPVCGMDLVKKSGHAAALEITEGIDHLLDATNTAMVSSIKTVTPVTKSLETSFNASGVITYDTRQTTTIPIRVAGRIEKLYIRYNFQPIKKGQKILEIYSPELLTAQRELLFLLNDDATNTTVIEGAKQKLRLLGVTESQINQLIHSKKEIYSLPVYSPFDGYVTEASTTNPSSQTMRSSSNSDEAAMGGGGDGPVPAPVSPPLQIREGSYLSAGQTVFRIINPEKVWAEFDIYQKDAPFIKKNNPVEIILNGDPESKIEASVSSIQPFFKEGESFSKVRVYLNNKDGHFKAGTLASGRFKGFVTEARWIPASAVVDLGNSKVVFLKKEDVFKPVKLITGRKSDDLIEVISGVEDTSEIAVDGQFLVDSESFIRAMIND